MNYKAALKLIDREFEDHVVTRIGESENGWTIIMENGLAFFVPRQKIVPKVGSKARLYVKGFGTVVRGLDIDGKEVFYRTPSEQEDKNKQDLLEMKESDKRKFEENKTALDADYASLPLEFQLRLDGFREANPDFRVDYEAYEMFCLKEAVKLSSFAQKRALEQYTQEEPLNKEAAKVIRAFQKSPFVTQKKLVPDLSDGHSGNTFGFSCRIAWLYLHSPELVPKEHGALCPLVGCQSYGCYAARNNGNNN